MKSSLRGLATIDPFISGILKCVDECLQGGGTADSPAGLVGVEHGASTKASVAGSNPAPATSISKERWKQLEYEHINRYAE